MDVTDTDLRKLAEEAERDGTFPAITGSAWLALLDRVAELERLNHDVIQDEVKWRNEAGSRGEARDSLAQAVVGLAEALNGVMTNVALDWYVDQFTKDETPSGPKSGIVARVHNAGVRERATRAFQDARSALTAHAAAIAQARKAVRG